MELDVQQKILAYSGEPILDSGMYSVGVLYARLVEWLKKNHASVFSEWQESDLSNINEELPLTLGSQLMSSLMNAELQSRDKQLTGEQKFRRGDLGNRLYRHTLGDAKGEPIIVSAEEISELKQALETTTTSMVYWRTRSMLESLKSSDDGKSKKKGEKNG